jgi:peptide/nickel transport system permease protein
VIRYIIRRLLWAVVLFLAVTAVTYAIFFVIPADPARLVAGKSASPQEVQRVRHVLGLDDPIYIQYAHFLRRLVIDHSLGTSYANRQEVNQIVADEAPVTASVVFGGMILWLLIAFPVGVYSALRPRSATDRVAVVAVLIGISAHPVWIGLILSYVFGYVPTQGQFAGISFPSFTFLPVQGYCEAITPPPGASQCAGNSVWEWFYHLILPWVTIAILYAAFYVRMIRGSVMETLSEDYVRTARAKGVRESRVIRTHVLRNALLPVVTMLGMDVALALGGATFTEIVFGLPGLGREAVQSVTNFDYPVTVGITVFATVVIIVLNLITDILYAYIDPRIRLS